MQSLCPALVGILCLAGVFSPALAPPALAQIKPAQVAASTPWPAAATPEQALSQAVSGWLGVQQGVDPAGIRLAPLDSRLQIKPCPAGLRLDFPFASQETVRVRCETPTWQLFVRVMSPSPALRPKVAGSGIEEKPVILRKVVVASGLLQRGSRLSADQISLVEVPANGLPANVLDRIDDAVNAELIRDVPAGIPLRSHDIRPALMIKRGQSVMVSAGSAAGFKVMARLEAMQDGRMGEQIKLRNKESGRQISAVVTGLNAADAL
jgi:flagella basal body P-ring formation protein FlgA